MLWSQRNSSPLPNIAKDSRCMSTLVVSFLSIHTAPKFSWILPATSSRAPHTAQSLWGALLTNRDLSIIPEAGLSGQNQIRMLNQLHWRRGKLHTVFRTERPWIVWLHRVERPLLRVSLRPNPNPILSETIPNPIMNMDFIMQGSLATFCFNLASGPYLCLIKGSVKVFSQTKDRFFPNMNSSPTLGMWKCCS